MNVVGRWLGPAALVALSVVSCGESKQPDGEGGRSRAGAGGASSSGLAGQGGAPDMGGAGQAAGGSMNGCEPSCEVDGGAPGTSGAASGGSSGSSGDNGGGPDAGSGEPSTVAYLATSYSLADASSYTFGPVGVTDVAPDRSLFVLVQTASNVIAVAQSVRVNGVEATKLVAVGEDVQPSAPSALFSIPFPSDAQATIEVELSATVVRCAISLLVAHGLQNPTGVDDSETLVSKTSGSMTVDVAAGGSVITALAMATSNTNASADMPGFQGVGYGDILSEGTPTLILLRAGDSRSAGPEVVNIVASDSTYNFRAFVAAVH